MNPQAIPLQVAVALGGGAHAVQDVVPQFAVEESLTHDPLQRWNPAMQGNPQTIPLHVAVALGGGAHAVQDVVPHELVLVLLTHDAPHA